MRFNPEGQHKGEEEPVELFGETKGIEEGPRYFENEEEVSLDSYFDDGFEDEMPENIVLKSSEDIKALEQKYNIDINSLIQKNN